MSSSHNSLRAERRRFLAVCSTFGLSSTLFPGVLWSLAADDPPAAITADMVDEAAAVAGITIADEHKEMLLASLNDRRGQIEAIRKLDLPNSVAPAFSFDPVPAGARIEQPPKRPTRMSDDAAELDVPENLEELAFATVRQLAGLVRSRKVASVALTKMYLDRLKRLDRQLLAVITFTEARALEQARRADREIAAGQYRGPLHGIPWGAKDLLSVKGYRTTWGAGGFEEQQFDEDATVVKRLDDAGAVLVAKLTLGALAMGDKWFGGMTRNPWKLDQGSSGSSAGSAAAAAAGCVGFAIGSETLGSISSPCTRVGATGLRPTFGRVPRTGAMALSWTMDKIGPICRCVEDCALVLDAIHGPDGSDRTVRDVPFSWDAKLDLKTVRVGYLKSDFERPIPARMGEEQKERAEEQKRFDAAVLDVLRDGLGLELIEAKLPDLPYGAMLPVLTVEAAAAFDQLTRSGRDKLLTEQGRGDWPNAFRAARFYPAVDYVNASRARGLAIEQMAEMFRHVDVVVSPTDGAQLLATNLTGHPAVILPNGFRSQDGTPTSITFFGNLFDEPKLLAVARAYQEATEFHRRRPTLRDVKAVAEKP
jgi:Asp-tRNA(Asn)/Glu-tRNA(Gln) amidotransferase A subunit family amidase